MAVNLKIVSQVVASGTPGPAGKSAYQIAVDNGFEGTESEWLKELHPFKGWFDSVSELEEEHSAPSVGEYAYIKGATSSDPVKIYECSTDGSWSDSGRTVDTSTVQTFRSGESVNDVDITDDSSDIEENSDKIPTAGAVANALGNATGKINENIEYIIKGEVFLETKTEDIEGVIDFRVPIGDLFPYYLKIEKYNGSNAEFSIRAYDSTNPSDRVMIVEHAKFGEYYQINPNFNTNKYDTLWLKSATPSTIAPTSSYSLYKTFNLSSFEPVSPMNLDEFPTDSIFKILAKDGSGNYTDFCTACDDLIANERTQPLSRVKLIIKKGDYIVSPNTCSRTSGPIVGFSIYAEKGVRLICDYDGAVASKVVAFSPINLYAEVSHEIVIDGIEIIAQNCRYCVHDEMGSGIVDSYKHIFRNCKFTHNTSPNSAWASPRCIGGGLGNSGDIQILNCELSSQINTAIDYHSGRDGECTGSKILVQNCKAPGNTFSGTTTQQPTANEKSIMICNGNEIASAPIQNNYQGRVEVLVVNCNE